MEKRNWGSLLEDSQKSKREKHQEENRTEPLGESAALPVKTNNYESSPSLNSTVAEPGPNERRILQILKNPSIAVLDDDKLLKTAILLLEKQNEDFLNQPHAQRGSREAGGIPAELLNRTANIDALTKILDGLSKKPE